MPVPGKQLAEGDPCQETRPSKAIWELNSNTDAFLHQRSIRNSPDLSLNRFKE